MPTPLRPTSPTHRLRLDPATGTAWRCSGCRKLLGVRRGSVLHIRFGRHHEYFTACPAEATCSNCGTRNQITVPMA